MECKSRGKVARWEKENLCSVGFLHNGGLQVVMRMFDVAVAIGLQGAAAEMSR